MDHQAGWIIFYQKAIQPSQSSMLGKRCIEMKTHDVVVSMVVALQVAAIKAGVALQNCFRLYSGALK